MRDDAQRGIDGELVWRDDGDYENTWSGELWNGLKPERYPEVIVRAASERDVPVAIKLARSRGLRVAVRAGGHSWCGSPLRDGGMLLDLSRLRRSEIDTATATATVQPGVIGRELAAELTRHGLAFPTGHCGSVALGGYLLSGGLGWNSGLWGPASASVDGIEAVTADGEVVRCDEEENPDLFWAARGAGPGFFAVVTSFRLRLYRSPAAISTTSYTFPLAALEPASRWASEIGRRLPPNVELALVLATADPALAAVAPKPKVITVGATAFADSPRSASQALEPLAVCPLTEQPLSRQRDEPTSLDALYRAAADVWPEGHRYAADTLWSAADYGTLLAKLGDALTDAPSDKSLVLAPIAPVSQEKDLMRNMAFSVLGQSYAVPYAVWEDPAQDDVNLRWLQDAVRAVEPLGTGHYIAEADLTARPDRAERSYTPADWERLRKLRAHYDPEGRFHTYLSP